MADLHGIGILVTRPQHQAMPLCRLLEVAGAVTYRLPAIDIKPLTDRRALSARLGNLANFDLIIFLSANAVRFGAGLLEQKRDLNLAAIGPATARALNQAGYRVAVQPAGGFDTESLLRHPTLHALAGKRILLIKGSGGRDLLPTELVRRGAEVVPADVYRRERPQPDASELATLELRFAAREIHLITATSVETVVNLLALATPSLGTQFGSVPWVVPGARIAAALRELAPGVSVIQADSAEDQDLVAAIRRWRSSESGA
jgi:uroporphyrinogen-III synthase